jgi:hypothetical protein
MWYTAWVRPAFTLLGIISALTLLGLYLAFR